MDFWTGARDFIADTAGLFGQLTAISAFITLILIKPLKNAKVARAAKEKAQAEMNKKLLDAVDAINQIEKQNLEIARAGAEADTEIKNQLIDILKVVKENRKMILEHDDELMEIKKWELQNEFQDIEAAGWASDARKDAFATKSMEYIKKGGNGLTETHLRVVLAMRNKPVRKRKAATEAEPDPICDESA